MRLFRAFKKNKNSIENIFDKNLKLGFGFFRLPVIETGG